MTDILAAGRIVTVTRAAKGFEVMRCPFASFPTAITLMVRWPDGGPYLKEVEIRSTFPTAGLGFGTGRISANAL
jgi:hypothetical protein